MFSNGCMNVPVVTSLNGNDGFGNGNGSWWLILFVLLFAFGGWGNGAWGGYGAGGVQENYVLTSDFSQLSRQIADAYSMTERKLDGVNNGLCDGFYTTAQQINGINQALTTQGYETRNAINGVGTQLAQCCCDIREGIAGVNYNLATQANGITNAIQSGFCQTNFNAQTNTRDIVDSQNAGTRAILDKLCAMEINAKDEKIAELTARNADLRLAASQQAQNNYLINELKPCPRAAYIVPNPYCGCQCGQNYGTTIA